MRSTGTLSRYAAREVLTYTVLGLLAISVVMVTQNLFRFIDEILAAGFALADVAAIARCLALMLATYTVPIAFLFGVLLAVSRLASDLEVTAMQACGVSLRSLMAPMVALGLVFSGLTAYLTLDVEHRAQLDLRRTVKAVAARGGLLESGRFRQLGDRTLFVRNVGGEGRLEGIVISDRSDPERPLMIFAETGRLAWDTEKSELRFHLESGDIHVDPPTDDTDRYQRISFHRFDYALEASDLLGRQFSTLRPREMTLDQLRGVLTRARAGESLDDLRRSDPVHYELQIHRRVALPFAPLLFAFVGVPLGLRRRRGARSWGMLACVLLIFVYYAVMTFSEFLALQRVIPAGAALWLPNLVFAGAAVWLLRRAARLRG